MNQTILVLAQGQFHASPIRLGVIAILINVVDLNSQDNNHSHSHHKIGSTHIKIVQDEIGLEAKDFSHLSKTKQIRARFSSFDQLRGTGIVFLGSGRRCFFSSDQSLGGRDSWLLSNSFPRRHTLFDQLLDRVFFL